jgi:hypothetical protein
MIVASAGVLYWTSNEIDPVSPEQVAGRFPTASAIPSAPIVIPPVKATPGKGSAQALAQGEKPVTGRAVPATEQKKQTAAVAEHYTAQVKHAVEPVIEPGNSEPAYTEYSDRAALEPLAPEKRKATINSAPAVTSSLAVRNTTIRTVETPAVAEEEPGAKKGSLKTFFRKATRMIAKTAGLEKPSEGEDEVLIGTMAVRLK